MANPASATKAVGALTAPAPAARPAAARPGAGNGLAWPEDPGGARAMSLPVSPDGTAGPAWPAPAAESATAAAKILVVEDSFIVRELQRCVLESAGHQVVTASDGREALAALKDDDDIELVVTDLEMPRLGGLDLTRAIRADEGRSSMPVVMVTSRGSEEDRRRGMEAGVDAYIDKQGFQQRALLETISQLLGR